MKISQIVCPNCGVIILANIPGKPDIWSDSISKGTCVSCGKIYKIKWKSGEESYSVLKENDDCFLTTVIIDILGEHVDDLEILRNFKNEQMMHNQEWKLLVEQYYTISPNMVNKIVEKNQLQAGYAKQLYENFVRNSCRLVQAGSFDEAIAVYCDMVKFIDRTD